MAQTALYPSTSKKDFDYHFYKTACCHGDFYPETCYLFLLYRSEVSRMLKTDETDDSSNLLVVAGKEVALLDGKHLELLWRFNTSSVLR